MRLVLNVSIFYSKADVLGRCPYVSTPILNVILILVVLITITNVHCKTESGSSFAYNKFMIVVYKPRLLLCALRGTAACQRGWLVCFPCGSPAPHKAPTSTVRQHHHIGSHESIALTRGLATFITLL